MKILRLCVLVFLPVLFAQTPPPAAPAAPAEPTTEEQAKIIADIRAAALSWESKLGDFTCNRTGRLEARSAQTQKASAAKSAAARGPASASKRSAPNQASAPNAGKPPAPVAAAPKASPPAGDPASSTTTVYGPWQTLQIVEDKVTYADHKESYSKGSGNPTAVAVAPVTGTTPGKDAPKGARPLPDAVPISAFSDLLKGIFDESAHTEFTWKGLFGLHGLPVQSFDYKVAKENSKQELVAGTSRITVGYHGTVYAERFSHRITTVAVVFDVPPDFPLTNAESVFDFGQVVVAGQFNVLPLKCQMQVQCSTDMLQEGKLGGKSPQVLAGLTTDFLSYHKYTAPAAAPGR